MLGSHSGRLSSSLCPWNSGCWAGQQGRGDLGGSARGDLRTVPKCGVSFVPASSSRLGSSSRSLAPGGPALRCGTRHSEKLPCPVCAPCGKRPSWALAPPDHLVRKSSTGTQLVPGLCAGDPGTAWSAWVLSFSHAEGGGGAFLTYPSTWRRLASLSGLVWLSVEETVRLLQASLSCVGRAAVRVHFSTRAPRAHCWTHSAMRRSLCLPAAGQRPRPASSNPQGRVQ